MDVKQHSVKLFVIVSVCLTARGVVGSADAGQWGSEGTATLLTLLPTYLPCPLQSARARARARVRVCVCVCVCMCVCERASARVCV